MLLPVWVPIYVVFPYLLNVFIYRIFSNLIHTFFTVSAG